MPKVNWNTLLITAQAAVIWYFGKDLIETVRATREDVLVMKSQMVDHRQYDLEMADVKSRIQSIEVQLQQLKHTP